ncbi:Glycosyl transferase, family I [Desulfonema limicola]|uniref:Glycosyl transferase, family I n=1 Tax=Desulfonema limicola TaxID=45656 RepID=A0A975BD60_9BACT|nr:glycosyltransferase family 4 protein [Desulfonema limicola]QTA83332.1 Glycosyl transferase, family I [Desulfonema limicola]
MKILYISYVKYGAGDWVHTTQFLSALRSLHPEVEAYTPRARKPEPGKDQGGYQFSGWIGQLRELRFLAAAFTRRAFEEFQQIRKIRPDVVVLRSGGYFSSLVLCRILKIPILMEVNETVEEEKLFSSRDRLRWLTFWRWFEKKILEMPAHFTVVSEPLRRFFIGRGFSPQKITCVPNGVNIREFYPGAGSDSIRKKLGIEGKTIIGFSGNFAKWHGLDFLAEALKEFFAIHSKDNIAILLIGQPGSRFDMPEFPKDITIVTGYIPFNQMPAYLDAVDIFIAPYPRIVPFYFSPIKIFEAMAMAKPVLASAQGQICEIIKDNVSGILYPPENMAVFLEKLSSLVDDKALCRNLGKNARQVIEKHYTWENNARTILELCRRFANLNKDQLLSK